jgi:hypothetical protein
VYTVPGGAPEATVKLPVNAPATIEHDCEVKRVDGTAVIMHVVPRKLEPTTETPVPTGPEIGGVNVIVGGGGTTNDALPASPVLPVTITMYEPLVPDATTNDPDIVPPATVHVELEIRSPVPPDEEIVHAPVSPLAKFEPMTMTVVPGRPEVGVSVIPGVTWKLATPTS